MLSDGEIDEPGVRCWGVLHELGGGGGKAMSPDRSPLTFRTVRRNPEPHITVNQLLNFALGIRAGAVKRPKDLAWIGEESCPGSSANVVRPGTDNYDRLCYRRGDVVGVRYSMHPQPFNR
jgi:hypothetical protein